jgi:hypothetical protein
MRDAPNLLLTSAQAETSREVYFSDPEPNETCKNNSYYAISLGCLCCLMSSGQNFPCKRGGVKTAT